MRRRATEPILSDCMGVLAQTSGGGQTIAVTILVAAVVGVMVFGRWWMGPIRSGRSRIRAEPSRDRRAEDRREAPEDRRGGFEDR